MSINNDNSRSGCRGGPTEVWQLQGANGAGARLGPFWESGPTGAIPQCGTMSPDSRRYIGAKILNRMLRATPSAMVPPLRNYESSATRNPPSVVINKRQTAQTQRAMELRLQLW